ncbi:hypothetical protein AAVH_24685 [Aphelenchoides avenae]|nr:hypothetical protein AAVH_24685 [Aphelenchus avenae]
MLKVIIGANLGIPLLLISFVMALCYGHLLTYDAAYMLLGVYRASLLTIGALVGLGLSLITLVNIRGRSSRADHLETTLTVHCAIMLLIQLLSGVWSGMELVVISDQPPLIWASLGAYAYISINYQPVWYKWISMLVTALSRVRQKYLLFYRMKRSRPVDIMAVGSRAS